MHGDQEGVAGLDDSAVAAAPFVRPVARVQHNDGLRDIATDELIVDGYAFALALLLTAEVTALAELRRQLVDDPLAARNERVMQLADRPPRRRAAYSYCASARS